MWVIITISLLAILLVYLSDIGKLKNGFGIAFFLLTVIQTIQYGVGNDYFEYYDMFNRVTTANNTLEEAFNAGIKEPGWSVLCLICSWLGGFFVLVAVVAIITNLIYYSFIWHNVPKGSRAFAVSIYVLSSSFYLLNFSMLRQGLAIALFVYAFHFFRRGALSSILSGALITLFATLIHTSAFVVLPFVLFGLLKPSNFKWVSLFIVLLLPVLLLSSSFLNGIYEQMQALEMFDSYSRYYGDEESTMKYGLGFIISLIPFYFIQYYLYKSKDQELGALIIASLASIGTLIIPFSVLIPIIGRVGFYFSAFSIAAIPTVYKWISSKAIRILITFLYCVLLVYSYYMFFTDSVYANDYHTYQTIFSVIL